MNAFFLLLKHRKIAKERKQALRLPKNFLNCWHRTTALFSLGIVAILLAHTRNSRKFYRFDSAQNLVSFFNLSFFWFVFGLFCCQGWHSFKFVLKFRAKMSLVVFENCSFQKSVTFCYFCQLALLNIS